MGRMSPRSGAGAGGPGTVNRPSRARSGLRTDRPVASDQAAADTGVSLAPGGALPQRGRFRARAHQDAHARDVQPAADYRRHRIQPNGERILARETSLDLEQGREPAGTGTALIAEQSREDADRRRHGQRDQPVHRGTGQSLRARWRATRAAPGKARP